MGNLLDNVRSVLDEAGYVTVSPQPDTDHLQFEDISIMGYVQTLPSVEAMLKSWKEIQDTFLRENATRFLRDATKAWNLYTVFLTEQPSTGTFAADLFAIEEDFRGTRKITRAGIVSRDDVLTVLSPLLPLQNLLSLGVRDAGKRLRDRLGAAHPVLTGLVTDASAEATAAALLGDE